MKFKQIMACYDSIGSTIYALGEDGFVYEWSGFTEGWVKLDTD